MKEENHITTINDYEFKIWVMSNLNLLLSYNLIMMFVNDEMGFYDLKLFGVSDKDLRRLIPLFDNQNSHTYGSMTQYAYVN